MAKNEYVWAIGDIHGNASSLASVLKTIHEFGAKKIIFIGDYIDRGPDSKETIDLIQDLKVETITLMGNHEAMLLEAVNSKVVDQKAADLWKEYGCETTLKSFNVADIGSIGKQLDKKYLDFFENLKVFHTESFGSGKKKVNFLFCHAGPFLDFPLEEQLAIGNYEDLSKYLKEKGINPENSCLWNDDKHLQKSMSSWDNNLLVHGHMRTQYRFTRNRLQYEGKNEKADDLSDVPNPLYFPGGSAISALDIDTGVDIGGKLTAIGISEADFDYGSGKVIMKVIQADPSRKGHEPRALTFHLTLPFTDQLGFMHKLMKSIFGSKKKKKAPAPAPVHHHGAGHTHH